jgi:hypothetical protein
MDCELEVNILRQLKFSLAGQIRDLMTSKCTVAIVEIIEAQQAKLCNTYRNTKLKLLKKREIIVIFNLNFNI